MAIRNKQVKKGGKRVAKAPGKIYRREVHFGEATKEKIDMNAKRMGLIHTIGESNQKRWIEILIHTTLWPKGPKQEKLFE